MGGAAIISGSAGLIGSESCRFFARLGLDVVGIDNDLRAVFFGCEASTAPNRVRLEKELRGKYRHHELDVRDREGIDRLFADLGQSVELVVHTAAQPSHDWAAREPLTDFEINAVGTLNLLESTRRHACDAAFIFMSTNKVYGDTPNSLPFVELESRWEIDPCHSYAGGIREDMTIDRSLHSIFGASKVAADIMVQEFGRYFEMNTACLRAGTLTGPHHAAAELHGFLGYVMRCAMTGRPYVINGYKGKQVRDAIHSADLVAAIGEIHRAPRRGEVYNIGGGRFSNLSVLEAIALSEEIAGRRIDWRYDENSRVGDHQWWISDNGHFEKHYPGWKMTFDAREILEEIYAANVKRWTA